MADPSSYPDVATDANYTSGPDSGTPTKVTLASLDTQGFLNGVDNAPLAQWLNSKLNLSGLWIRRLAEEATTLLAGRMSAADKTKLDGLSNDMSYPATVTSSRALQTGDKSKALEVDSTSGAVVITFPKDATLDLGTGANGVIRWVAGANQVSVAEEDGTVTILSSGDEMKLARLGAQIYWERRGSNSYFVSGEKMA